MGRCFGWLDFGLGFLGRWLGFMVVVWRMIRRRRLPAMVTLWGARGALVVRWWQTWVFFFLELQVDMQTQVLGDEDVLFSFRSDGACSSVLCFACVGGK